MKNWIDDNLMKNGKLISKRCRVDWFINTDNKSIYDSIMFNTMFLDDNSTLIERLYCIYNDITTVTKCATCKCSNAKFKSFKFGYGYCSNSCSQKSEEHKNKIKELNMVRFGANHYVQTDEFKNKAKQTWISKYGVDNPSKSDIVKNKKIDTCISNFGVKYPQQSDIVKNKSINTNITRYGVPNVMQDETISNLSRNARVITEFDRFYNTDRLSNYVEPLFNVDEYDGINKEYGFKCKLCNDEFYTKLKSGRVPRCYNCYPRNPINSKYELELGDYIESLGIKVERGNKTIIYPSEIDIYLPDLKIGIEFNGLYWHSEISGNKSKNYHLDKTLRCMNNGVHLIHVFEDDWINKQSIIKNRIRNLVGKNDIKIYARKTVLHEISSKQCRQFMEDNHLQGYIPSNFQVGLFYNNELVSVMSFSKRKILNNKSEWELARYASIGNVVGGFSKLLRYFEKTKNPSTLVSYALRTWSKNDNIYINNGFTLSSEGTPNYFYIVDGVRYSRISFQKHKLKNKLSKFNETLTEWENMKSNGYDRIWDCGSYKYVKKYFQYTY